MIIEGRPCDNPSWQCDKYGDGTSYVMKTGTGEDREREAEVERQ